MIETLTNIQWCAISIAALSIGMSKTGVQGFMLMIVPLIVVKLLPTAEYASLKFFQKRSSKDSYR